MTNNYHSYECEDLPFEETPLSEENRKLKYYIGKLEHDLFFLYVFLTAQDDCEEACAYLQSHEEDPLPFRIPY